VEMNQALKLSDVTFEQVTNVNCELEVAEMWCIPQPWM
jgi:hypothetical protein